MQIFQTGHFRSARGLSTMAVALVAAVGMIMLTACDEPAPPAEEAEEPVIEGGERPHFPEVADQADEVEAAAGADEVEAPEVEAEVELEIDEDSEGIEAADDEEAEEDDESDDE